MKQMIFTGMIVAGKSIRRDVGEGATDLAKRFFEKYHSSMILALGNYLIEHPIIL